MIQWQDLHHSDLTVNELYALLKLRCECGEVIVSAL